MVLTVVKRLICKKCDQPIEPFTGVIIQGNVYVVGADSDARGGIIGNAIKEEPVMIIPGVDAQILEEQASMEATFDLNLAARLTDCSAKVVRHVVYVDEVALHIDCLFTLIKGNMEPTDG